MDVNIKALLEYLNIPNVGKYIVSPTTFYLVEGSWMISPKAYGVRVTTTAGTNSVRDMKAYALLMRVIGDSKHIIPYMEQVVETLIKRVSNCSMNKFILVYDKDESCIEVVGTIITHMGENGEDSRKSSRRTWRIDTLAKTLHYYTPNQWMRESSTWNVEDYYQDIAGCLILLNDINKHIVTNESTKPCKE